MFWTGTQRQTFEQPLDVLAPMGRVAIPAINSVRTRTVPPLFPRRGAFQCHLIRQPSAQHVPSHRAPRQGRVRVTITDPIRVRRPGPFSVRSGQGQGDCHRPWLCQFHVGSRVEEKPVLVLKLYARAMRNAGGLQFWSVEMSSRITCSSADFSAPSSLCSWNFLSVALHGGQMEDRTGVNPRRILFGH